MEAAKVIDSSPRTLGRMEEGKTSPDVAQLYALARLYKLPMSLIMFGADSPLVDLSRLWPHTREAIKTHIDRLLDAQETVESHWPERVERIRRGDIRVEPPWR